MKEGGKAEIRFNIEYFDGINSTVQHNLSKRTELYHAENVRSPIIGSLEKRRGQSKIDSNGTAMVGNYGLFRFPTTDNTQKGVFKISAPAGTANIYSLNSTDNWTILADADAQGLTKSQFDTAKMDGGVIICNGIDDNILLENDGSTVISSTDAGNLYNSPKAHKTAFYKGRIYFADFTYGTERYKTSIVRSSYALGIIALVNGDYDNGGGAANWVLPVTDTKFFYTTPAGMNEYEVYRGGTKVATMTISSIEESTITATNANVTFEAGHTNFLSSDEVWISGTYSGEKQYRWVNNSSIGGRDVKQYNTFKLSGGDEDAITMFDTIGNILLIGNKWSLMTWDDYNLVGLDYGIGCVSNNGSTKLLGSLYFLHYSGVYVTTGGVPKLISRKIARYISGASKTSLETAAMGHKGLSIFVSIGDVNLFKPDGSPEKTLRDVCLEYSIADENWYVHTNVPASEFETFIDTDGSERLLIAHTGSGTHIKEFLDNSSFTDDGAEIFMRLDTQKIQLRKEFDVYSIPISLITEVERGSSMKAMVALDNEDYYELKGTLEKGTSAIKIQSVKNDEEEPDICKKISISLRDSSRQSCRISQLSLVYIPTNIDHSK